MEMKDKDGNDIKDGDRFLYKSREESIKGSRVGNNLVWDDGMILTIDEFWLIGNEEKYFELIEDK